MGPGKRGRVDAAAAGAPTAVLMIRNMGVEGTPSVMLQVTTPSIFQTRDPGDQTNW